MGELPEAKLASKIRNRRDLIWIRIEPGQIEAAKNIAGAKHVSVSNPTQHVDRRRNTARGKAR